MRRKIKSCCSRSCRPPAGETAGRAGPLLLLGLLLLGLLLLLAACGGQRRQDDSLRIGVALYTQDDTFISSMSQDLEQLAQEAGVDLSALSLMGFFSNMLPVTIGNIIGGCGFGALIWATQRPGK